MGPRQPAATQGPRRRWWTFAGGVTKEVCYGTVTGVATEGDMTQNTYPHCSGLNPEDYEELTGFVGDWRDTWWDQDFLQMMARKWSAQSIGTVLDVGCGVGHWGQRLMTLMGEEATLEGVDAETSWIDKAHTRATSQGLGNRARFKVADAYALPYQDGAFDMVTCQTLLMHVKDPQAVVREMARVLRPGGLFVAAEPNNFGSSAGSMVAGRRKSWEESGFWRKRKDNQQANYCVDDRGVNLHGRKHTSFFLASRSAEKFYIEHNIQCHPWPQSRAPQAHPHCAP